MKNEDGTRQVSAARRLAFMEPWRRLPVLQKIRSLFMALALACAVALTTLAATERSDRAQLLVPSLVGLGIIWYFTYRRGHLSTPGQIVELVLVLGANVADNNTGYGTSVVTLGLFFRALYGGTARVVVLASSWGLMNILAAVVGPSASAVQIEGQIGRLPLAVISAVLLIGFALPFRMLAWLLARHEQDAARERVILTAGADLAMAGRRHDVARLAAKAAQDLISINVTQRCAQDSLVGLAEFVAQPIAEPLAGTHEPRAALHFVLAVDAPAERPRLTESSARREVAANSPAEQRVHDALVRRQTIQFGPLVDSERAALVKVGYPGADVYEYFTQVPLIRGPQVLGALTVASRGVMPKDVVEGLCALASITVLALDRAELAEQLHRQAYYDSLTGLANRALLFVQLGHAMATADVNRPVGLLLIDLDGFKAVNDTYGHVSGDQLLAAVASRLRDCLPTSPDPWRTHPGTPMGTDTASGGTGWSATDDEGELDLVARLGGDEFAVLISCAPAQVLRPIAERIRTTLSRPYVLGEGLDAISVTIGASVGVASTSDPTLPASTLLLEADRAMYQIKRATKAAQTAAASAASPAAIHI